MWDNKGASVMKYVYVVMFTSLMGPRRYRVFSTHKRARRFLDKTVHYYDTSFVAKIEVNADE